MNMNWNCLDSCLSAFAPFLLFAFSTHYVFMNLTPIIDLGTFAFTLFAKVYTL